MMEERQSHPVSCGPRSLKSVRRLPFIRDQRLPPTLRLLESRQESRELQAALAAEREEGHSTKEVLALRWEELHAQEAELRGHLLRFQPHIVEKEVKCLQAVKKAKGAQEIYKMKEQQLRVLQEERRSLLKRKRKIQDQILHYSKFCDYLESTVEASEEFQCSDDVLGRFHTLLATSYYLQQVVRDTQASIEQVKGQLSRFLEVKNDEALQFDNQLAQLQAALEHAQNRRIVWRLQKFIRSVLLRVRICNRQIPSEDFYTIPEMAKMALELESRWAHTKNLATTKTLLIGTIKMAVLNLFQCIAMPGSAAMDDTVRQLEMVQQYIQDLSDIYEDTRRKLMTDPA